MSTINPIRDRVFVRPTPAEERTSSGIIIPDTAQEKPMRGTVTAIGPGTEEEPMTLTVGQQVLYAKYAGTEITIDNEKYVILNLSDIYAVLN